MAGSRAVAGDDDRLALSRLAVGVFGLRSSLHFGDGSLTHANAERPLTAKEDVAYFK